MTDADALLRKIGAVKLRESSHVIWKLPNGSLVTMAQTASDTRAVKNQVALIERLMGWRRRTARVGVPREPKRRSRQNAPSPWVSPAIHVKLRDFREQMQRLLDQEGNPAERVHA